MFCQNQHIVGNIQETFKKAIQQVKSLAISIPNPSDPVAATRIWCLFEIMSAIIGNKDILVFCNAAADVKDASVPKVSAAEAQATVETDKEMILDLIARDVKGGLEELNMRVGKALKQGLIQAEVTQAMASQYRKDEIERLKRAEKRKQKGMGDAMRMAKTLAMDDFMDDDTDDEIKDQVRKLKRGKKKAFFRVK